MGKAEYRSQDLNKYLPEWCSLCLVSEGRTKQIYVGLYLGY